MKTRIPDELKADMPQNHWGKVLAATPVVMTVIATLLAGLASSEMTRAQYTRSLAAQQQSKAGDQWNFFQAKRLRGSMQRGTLDLLQSTVPLRLLDAAVLRQAGAGELTALLDTPAGQSALAALTRSELPTIPASPPPHPNVKAAADAMESTRAEAELVPFIAALTVPLLDDALRNAKDRATALDIALTPVSQAVEQMEKLLAKVAGDSVGALNSVSLVRDFTAARLRYTALRYDAEARANQGVANVYELLVRQSNSTAERHHRRSQRFFFGMLAAQAAVIISTFSLATRQRSVLWSLAALAGLAAIGFAVYVYFFV